MSHDYPSDISRELFEEIRPILVSARKRTKPQKYDLYDIFCAILYILKSGSQWRMLPKDYPKWQLCYYYFTVWGEKNDENLSIIEQVLKKISRRNTPSGWQGSENEFHYYRCPECQKLRHGRTKRV